MKQTTSKLLSIVVLGCGCIQSQATADTISLTPENTLRIDFTSDPTSTPCPSSSCDVLALFLVLSVPKPPGVLASASLYNGATLLGSTTADPALGLEFRSAGSAFGLGTIIDFSPLQAPFSGYFYVTATNTLSIDTVLTNVDLGHGTSAFGFSYNPGTAHVSTITVVPEPSYAVLAGVLLCCARISRLARSSQRRRLA